MLTLQVTIFSVMAIGFLLKKIKLISARGQKEITDLVINLILPAEMSEICHYLLQCRIPWESGCGGSIRSGRSDACQCVSDSAAYHDVVRRNCYFLRGIR